MPRFESSTPGPDTSFLDLIDYEAPHTADSGVIMRGGGRLNGTPASASGYVLNTSTGSPNITILNGRNWYGFLSQAAVTLRGGYYATQITRTPIFPFGQDWSAFPASARGDLNLRYTFKAALQRTVPIVGDGRFGMGINFSTTVSLIGEDATGVGVEITSKPTVNAGRWTAGWRAAPAGALNTADLGVAPDGTFQAFSINYDWVTRLLTFAVNDVVTAIVPNAQIPDPTTVVGAYSQWLGVFAYNGGVANQQDRFGQCRIIVSVI